jgi:hypothetical protein
MQAVSWKCWNIKLKYTRFEIEYTRSKILLIRHLLQADSGRFLWDICCCRQISVENLLLLLFLMTVNDADYVASNESSLNKYFGRVVKKRSMPKCQMWIWSNHIPWKQSHYGPSWIQEVKALRYRDNRHMKVVRLSVLRTGRLYP